MSLITIESPNGSEVGKYKDEILTDEEIINKLREIESKRKESLKIAQKKYYEKHKDQFLKRQRDYYAGHREKVKANCQRWRDKNPEKFNEIVKKYREMNRDKINAQQESEQSRLRRTTRIQCECGDTYTFYRKLDHMKTARCIKKREGPIETKSEACPVSVKVEPVPVDPKILQEWASNKIYCECGKFYSKYNTKHLTSKKCLAKRAKASLEPVIDMDNFAE